MLQSMGSQRGGQDLATKQQQQYVYPLTLEPPSNSKKHSFQESEATEAKMKVLRQSQQGRAFQVTHFS